MGVKTAGVGHFAIPTAPAGGTSVTSGSANAFSASYVQLIASTAAAIYITGIYVESAAVSAATYKITQLAVGGAGAESVVGQYLVDMATGSTVSRGFRPIFPPIPVANGARIACKTADSVGSQATLITLECINQSNVVDDGITVGTVNLVNTLTTYTGNTLQTGDSFAVVKSGGTGDNAAIKAKTDNLPASPASTTNITAGTITTATNLTNAPTAGDFTATMKTSIGTAVAASAVASVTGNVGGNVTGSVGSVVGAVGSVTGLTAANLDATVSSRLASASYTAPDNTSVTAIKAKTDSLTFTAAGHLDANTLKVNGVTIIGDGSGTPFQV